jgi:hypothetical protein
MWPHPTFYKYKYQNLVPVHTMKACKWRRGGSQSLSGRYGGEKYLLPCRDAKPGLSNPWPGRYTDCALPATNWLTNYLTSYMEQSPPWRAQSLWDSQEDPGFYGNRRFITVFTRNCLLCVSRDRLIQCLPSYPISWRSILILSSDLLLSLPSNFHYVSPPKPCTNVSSISC